MFEYGLFENPLTPNPNDYLARILNLEVANEETILNMMVVPGGVSKTQVTAVLTARKMAVEEILLSGKAVMTDFCEIKPGIRGIFISNEDVFDPRRHTLVLYAVLRKKYRDLAKAIKTKKVSVSERLPMPLRFLDTATQRRDEVISNGMVGEIKGKYLKFDPADPNQGVFIKKANNTEVRCENYIHNTDSKLLFYVPDTLTVGEDLKLEVRNKLNDSVNEERSGLLAKTLSVV